MKQCLMCGSTRRRDHRPSGHCRDCECAQCMAEDGYVAHEIEHACTGDEPTLAPIARKQADEDED